MRLFLCVPVLLAVARAGEPVVDPATRHLPAAAKVVVRFAPLERLDEIGKQLGPLWELIEERRPLSEILLTELHAEQLPIDRTKPIYLAAVELEAYWIGHLMEGALMAETPLDDGRIALLREGMIHIAAPKAVDKPRRAGPVAILDGDLSVMLSVHELSAEHREALREGPRNLERSLPRILRNLPIRVPRAAVRLLLMITEVAVTSALGVEDVHYALSLRGRKLESEGWIRSAPRSELRAFLSKPSPPVAHRLMGYLPRDAALMVDSCGIAAWLDREVAAMLDRGFGEGAGRALLLFFSPAYSLADHLTGNAAGTVSLLGLGAGQARAIHEIRPEAPIEEAIANLDIGKINTVWANLEIPISFSLERNVAQYGEAKIHRLSMQTSVPQVAVLTGQFLTCFAVEGRYLFVTQSATAETDLKSLIDAVRRGEPGDHPHLKAMGRLAEERHEGLTFDLAALKPIIALAAPLAPEIGKLAIAMPASMPVSTALTVRDGHIHIRGDWPLFEAIAVAKALKEG